MTPVAHEQDAASQFGGPHPPHLRTPGSALEASANVRKWRNRGRKAEEISLRLIKRVRYVVPRLTISLASVIFVVTLVFVLIHLAPGDPLNYRYQTGSQLTPQVYQELRRHYGLDKSLIEQYTIYVRDIARGDLRNSFTYDVPVVTILWERLPATLTLMVPSILIGILLGTYIGISSARKPNSAKDIALRVLALVGYSIPPFWLGILLIQYFALGLQAFPTGGMFDPRLADGTVDFYVSIAWHAILPVATLSCFFVAMFARYSRTSILEQSTENYVLTARAKGLDQNQALNRHVLRNALTPLVTMVGVSMTYILGGAILIETVFSWPGIGMLTYNAILARDYPLIQGIFLFSAVSVILINFLIDIAYGLVDPRSRK